MSAAQEELCPPMRPVGPVYATLCAETGLGWNAGPTADFHVVVDAPNQTAYLTDASTDDGSIVAHSWSIENSTYGSANVTHAFQTRGTYVVSLTVTDDAGANDTATRNITIPDEAPAWNLTNQSLMVGQTMRYDLNVSDPEGDPITIQIHAAPQGFGIQNFTATWTPPAAGTFQIQLVAHSTNHSTPGNFTITVHPDNSTDDTPGNGDSGNPGDGHDAPSRGADDPAWEFEEKEEAPRWSYGGGYKGSSGGGTAGGGTTGGGTGTSSDSDRDGVADSHDNCPATPNHDQADADSNGIGDACDAPAEMASDGNATHGNATHATVAGDTDAHGGNGTEGAADGTEATADGQGNASAATAGPPQGTSEHAELSAVDTDAKPATAGTWAFWIFLLTLPLWVALGYRLWKATRPAPSPFS